MVSISGGKVAVVGSVWEVAVGVRMAMLDAGTKCCCMTPNGVKDGSIKW